MLGSAFAQADPTKTREDVRMVAPALEKYAQGTVLGDLWKRSGLSVRDRNEAAEADRAKRVGELFGAAFPGVVQYTTDVLFRDLWLRPGLAPRDRSLVTVSALVASGQVAQLAAHLNIGMNNGLTQTEIAEVFAHLAFYVGWPNVFSVMPVAKDVFAKR
jgi:4-carboxymuconolactone decarboxylase